MADKGPSRPTSLNRNWQFARAYKSKKRFSCAYFTTYVARGRFGVRLGVSASKKLGCAVKRNRARRIVKAAACELLKNAGGSFDIVFVCRAACLEKKSTELIPHMKRHLEGAGVL
ncbi:MAG: ribonuclease P protein component [Oscillospiraceae bacterium]|nr:ribonuclease P protein component [Oscillospiraceae bacterium]